MKVSVQIPTEEIIRSEFDYRAKKVVPVNVERKVIVKVFTGLDDIGKMCMKATGLTPAQYQSTFNRAWSE